eukprot:SAG31_NODE_319_length_17776_cov_4.703570_13_plen_201_part_00
MPSPKHADSPKQMFTNPLDDDDRSPMQRKPSSTGRGGAKPKREIKRATADQMREITERGKMAPEQLVDLFGKDSQPVVSKARGQMLIATFNHLFDHLRDKKDDTADTYGLWLVDHSSSEEEDAIDLTGVEGITHYDKRMRHVEAKNWKKAASTANTHPCSMHAHIDLETLEDCSFSLDQLVCRWKQLMCKGCQLMSCKSC